jgi:hypothetical protein
VPDSRLDEGTPVDPFESNQEPYIHIVAPGIDRISRGIFAKGSVERRRALRGLAILGVAVSVAVVIAAIGTLIAWLHGWA